MVQCLYCQNSCYRWETICHDCTHKATMKAINNLDKYLASLFVDYEQVKRSLTGELI